MKGAWDYVLKCKEMGLFDGLVHDAPFKVELKEIGDKKEKR